MNAAASLEMVYSHYTAMNFPGDTAIIGGTDVSVFERQQARMHWQQQQQQQQRQMLFSGNDHQVSNMLLPSMQVGSGLIEVKPDPGLQSGWPDFSGGCKDQLQSTMLTGAPGAGANYNSLTGADYNVKKRKTLEDQKLKVVCKENGVKEKKNKGCSEQNSTETSSKERSKATEAQKQDYIHVRARRGQATDSHSLAERVRREKISERMKYLQDLVPGCNKVTGKAGMLDEIINYVQSLQKQVEFLSMKLATLQPRLEFDIDDLIMKEMFEVPGVGYSYEVANSTYLQLNSLLEMGTNPIDTMMLRTSIGGPLAIPETFVVSSCFNQIQPCVTWDGDLHNLYRMEIQQESSTTSFPPYKFIGSYEGSNLKMEM